MPINNAVIVEQDPVKELERQLAYLESNEVPVRELRLKNPIKHAARLAEVKARLKGVKGLELAKVQDNALEEAREKLDRNNAKQAVKDEADEAKAKEEALPKAIERSKELAEAELAERERVESIKGDVKVAEKKEPKELGSKHK